MLVKDLMSTHIEAVAPSVTVKDCARRMEKQAIGALPVAENGRLVGIVTDRDICCRIFKDGRDLEGMTVRDVMTTTVAHCREDQTCAEAAKLMERKRVRRLPVMNRGQKVTGMLSLDDLAHHSHELAGEVLDSISPWPH